MRSPLMTISQSIPPRAIMCLGIVALLLTAGCETSSEPEADEPPVADEPIPPPPPVLLRLTQTQYRTAMTDLFGTNISLPTALELDTRADGLFAVGAGLAPISSRGSEQYADAALSIGRQVVDETHRAAAVPCSPASTADAACFETLARTLGRRTWRRPLTHTEVTSLVTIGTTAATALEDFYGGAAYVVSALLQSPHFLYRVELGNGSALTPFELASRLSFFLW
ncbi:MAG: hypothetical protein ACI9OJ_003530, partial [Myxococcota bacterium]